MMIFLILVAPIFSILDYYAPKKKESIEKSAGLFGPSIKAIP